MTSRELLIVVANRLIEIEARQAALELLQEQIAKTVPPPDDTAPICVEYEAKALELVKLEYEHQVACEQWAADPLIRLFMYCWLIEVSGTPDMVVPAKLSDDASEGLLEAMSETPDDFAAKVGGLMAPVRNLIRSLGYMPYETTVSEKAWAYGICADDNEAMAIICYLRAKFHRAFESKSIGIRKKFYGWHFKMLPNGTAAKQYLAALAEMDADPDQDDDDE